MDHASRHEGRRLKSVLLCALILLVVEACGGVTRTDGSGDDAGPALDDDAGTFTGLHGADGAACGGLGEACCSTIATQSQPVVAGELSAEGVGVTCLEGLACVMSVCERPSGADAGAKPTGDAGTSGPPGARPAGPTLAVADHACVIRGGKLECWGANYAGELGIGVTTGPQSCSSNGVACSPTPVTVTGLSGSIDSVSAGDGETCVLLAGGTVACWGLNELGQLGDGSASGPEVCPNGVPCSTRPEVVPGLSGATAVATNGLEVCAVVSNGVVKCWGNNLNGELGNAAAEDGNPWSSVPTMVTGLTGATAVALGVVHACALLLDGTVECWGSDANGELGNGSTTDSTPPVHVSGVTGAVAIAAGAHHTCALMADGTVVCWGDNGFGELGIGTSSGPQACPSNPCATTPVKIPNLSGVTAIAAGVEDTCALLSNGTVRCWGWNADGQLGNGTTALSSTPVIVSGLSGATAIAVGDESACALVSSGGIVCWGNNYSGELASPATGPQMCNADNDPYALDGDPCSTTPRTVSGL